jgi:hypothetical protein
MKVQISFLPLLIGAFWLISASAQAQSDSVHVAVEKKAADGKWASPKKVEWIQADAASESDTPESDHHAQRLHQVEVLQKTPEHTASETRLVQRDAVLAAKREQKAAKRAQKQARAGEKPRRIKNQSNLPVKSPVFLALRPEF